MAVLADIPDLGWFAESRLWTGGGGGFRLMTRAAFVRHMHDKLFIVTTIHAEIAIVKFAPFGAAGGEF